MRDCRWYVVRRPYGSGPIIKVHTLDMAAREIQRMGGGFYSGYRIYYTKDGIIKDVTEDAKIRLNFLESWYFFPINDPSGSTNEGRD